MQRAKQQALADGKFLGGRRPFGYEDDGLSVRDSEAAALRHMTRELLGGASLRSVARWCADEGVVSTTGKPLTPTAIRRIVLRPRNAGLVDYDGTTARCAAIVERDELLAVRAILTNPKRRTAKGTALKWQGSGAYICAESGEPMRISAATSKDPTPVYRPVSRRGGATADAASLDAYVDGAIVARLQRDDARELLTPTDDAVDHKALNDNRDGLTARLDEAAGLFADGVLTASQLATITTELREQLAAIDRQLAASDELPELRELLDADDIDAAWIDLHVEKRNRIIKSLLRVEVYRMSSRGIKRVFDPSKVALTWLNES
ncbi:recombinase family protein [Gordonia humi]